MAGLHIKVTEDKLPNTPLKKKKKNCLDARQKWKLQNWVNDNQQQITDEKFTLEQIASLASRELEIEANAANIAGAYHAIGLKCPRTKEYKIKVHNLRVENEELKDRLLSLEKIVVFMYNDAYKNADAGYSSKIPQEIRALIAQIGGIL